MLRRFLKGLKADKKGFKDSPFPEIQEMIGPRYRLLSRESDHFFRGTCPEQAPYLIWVATYWDEEMVNRSQRNYEACRSLDGHPSLAPFTDFGAGAKGLWLARRYREGPTAEEILRQGPQHPDLVKRWVDSLLKGLAALESAGLLFRDWQSDKILLTEEGAVLCDIGHEPYRNVTVAGSPFQHHLPHYMAPEVITGNEMSPSADLFSLGALTFHLLTGQLPHQGKEPMEVVFKILSEPAPSLVETRPDLPAGLARLVDHLLQKAPEERAGRRISELLEMLERESFQVRTPPPSEEMTDFLKFARVGGRKEDSGVFTLDPVRALEKLSRFQFVLPHHFLVALLAASPGLRAERVEILSGPDLLELKFRCSPRSVQELETVLFAACEGNRGNPLCHIGYGVVGALGAGFQCIEITSGKKTASFTAPEPPSLKRGKFEGLRIAMKGHFVGQNLPLDLSERLLHYPAPVSWNGTEICLPPRTRPHRFQIAEDCWLEATGNHRTAGLYLRVYGLSFRVPASFPLFDNRLVLDGPWKLDVSYSGIQEDQRRSELEKAAGDWLLDAMFQSRLNSPVDLSRPDIYATLLEHCPNEETRDALHAAIVTAASAHSGEESTTREEPRPPRYSLQRLIQDSCLHVRKKRLPEFSRASRILASNRCYFQQLENSWEEAVELASDAFPHDPIEAETYLFWAWMGNTKVSPDRDSVTSLLKHCASIPGDSWTVWDRDLLSRLRQYKPKREWITLLPEQGFPECRAWLQMNCGPLSLDE